MKKETGRPSAVLMELHFLPSVQYFTKFLLYDTVYIEQHENYRKGSYRNRCRIAGPNGELTLSIPLERGKNERQSIRKVRIAYHEPWRRRHWHSIRTAYGSAPFFEFYAEELEPLFEERFVYLFDFNWTLLQTIVEMMRLPTRIRRTESWQAEYPPEILDLRNCIFPQNHRQKDDPQFHPAPYPQVFREKHGFLPNLSILDLLFCTGPEAREILERSI
jgi:hypothetical protein